MSRPLRIEKAGMWYHVMNRGNASHDIFISERDYISFCIGLEKNCKLYGVEIHAYILMRNHFHLFLRTLDANLSRFMHDLLTGISVSYNLKHERHGHLFQGRYKAIIVDNNNYGNEVSRYIHLNPLRTKATAKLSLKKRLKILENYKWSSYRAMIDLEDEPQWLVCGNTLQQFGKTKREQQKNYRQYINEGLLREVHNPFDKIISQSILGDKKFADKICLNILDDKVIDKQSLGKKKEITAISLSQILDIVSKEYNISINKLCERKSGRKGCEARQIVLWLASNYCIGKMTLREIGIKMGGIKTSAVSFAKKRMEEKLRKNKRLLKQVNKLSKLCNVYP